MEISEIAVKVPHTQSEWSLHHVTDLHKDNPLFAEKEWLERRKAIEEDPHALWLGGGDYCDWILPTDPRWEGETPPGGVPYASHVTAMKDEIVEMFWPIRDKCIGFGLGNHERTLAKKLFRNPVGEAAYELGIQDKWLGIMGMAHVRFWYHKRNQNLKVWWYHGWSAGRSKGRKSLHAERELGATEADVYMVGHDHQPNIECWYQRQTYYNTKQKKWEFRESPRAFMNGGSMLYGQSPPTKGKLAKSGADLPAPTWLEGKAYRPEPPRSPVLVVNVDMGGGGGGKDKPVKKVRPMGFDFKETMWSPRFYPADLNE